ncbi:MAG: hypothetical protein IJK56_08720 [Firmicutes bacterium]|nr:hypothetical protein [Bacillota bacterium]
MDVFYPPFTEAFLVETADLILLMYQDAGDAHPEFSVCLSEDRKRMANSRAARSDRSDDRARRYPVHAEGFLESGS